MLARLIDGVRRRISPTERAFHRVWPMIDGVEGFLISPAQERWLFGAARVLPDRSTIVEIGSFKGRSTTCLAYGCRGTAKHIYAVDTFAGNDKDFTPGSLFDGVSYAEIFKRNIARNGLSQYVTQIVGVSAEVGKTWTRSIDFLFIDGGHEFEDVYTDFVTFFPHVVPGGLVAFHDVHDFAVNRGEPGFPGVLKVWTEIAQPQLVETGRCATIAFGRKP